MRTRRPQASRSGSSSIIRQEQVDEVDSVRMVGEGRSHAVPVGVTGPVFHHHRAPRLQRIGGDLLAALKAARRALRPRADASEDDKGRAEGHTHQRAPAQMTLTEVCAGQTAKRLTPLLWGEANFSVTEVVVGVTP